MPYRTFLVLTLFVSTQIFAVDFRSSPAVAEVFSAANVNGTFVLSDVSNQQSGKQEIRRVQVPNSEAPVSQAVVVPPNATTVYLSGMMPDVNNKDAPSNSLKAYGDTEAQTVSVFRRIEAALARQDLTLGDIVQLKVYLVGDPRQNGSLDFAGFQRGYSKFFSTREQPHKPVRSVLQIAGLAQPGALVEIEATAAKVR